MYAPIALVLLTNAIIYGMVLRVLWKKRSGAKLRKDAESARRAKQARASISLCFLLGVTWIVGLFMITSPAIELQWIFTVTNSLQGFALFFFYTVSHEKLHKEVGDTIYTSVTGKQRVNKSATTNSVSNAAHSSYGERVKQLRTAKGASSNTNSNSDSRQTSDWDALSPTAGSKWKSRAKIVGKLGRASSRVNVASEDSGLSPQSTLRRGSSPGIPSSRSSTLERSFMSTSSRRSTLENEDTLRFSAPLPAAKKKPSKWAAIRSSSISKPSRSSSNADSTGVSSSRSLSRLQKDSQFSQSMDASSKSSTLLSSNSLAPPGMSSKRRGSAPAVAGGSVLGSQLARATSVGASDRFSAPLPPVKKKKSKWASLGAAVSLGRATSSASRGTVHSSSPSGSSDNSFPDDEVDFAVPKSAKLPPKLKLEPDSSSRRCSAPSISNIVELKSSQLARSKSLDNEDRLSAPLPAVKKGKTPLSNVPGSTASNNPALPGSPGTARRRSSSPIYVDDMPQVEAASRAPAEYGHYLTASRRALSVSTIMESDDEDAGGETMLT